MIDVPRQSRRLTFDDAVQVHLMWWDGIPKHQIAAHFNVNVARLYEVRRGQLHPGSEDEARIIRAREKQEA